MDSISQLIFNRLARRQRVNLSGLGVLYTERQPALVDAAGTLTAPRVQVCLGPAEESADESENLSEALAAESGIPLRDIRPQVHRWLTELKNESNNGVLSIDGVVRLTRQGDGSWQAVASAELDALLNPIAPQPIAAPVASGAKRKKGRGIGWWIVLGLLLGLSAWLGGYRYMRGEFPAPIERMLHPVADPPVVAEPVVAVDTLPEAPVADTVVTAPVVEPVTEPAEPAYHIVVGVYSTRENAERFIRESGLDASKTEIFTTATGKFQVRFGRYPDKPSADREAAKLRARIPGVWVSRK